MGRGSGNYGEGEAKGEEWGEGWMCYRGGWESPVGKAVYGQRVILSGLLTVPLTTPCYWLKGHYCKHPGQQSKITITALSTGRVKSYGFYLSGTTRNST